MISRSCRHPEVDVKYEEKHEFTCSALFSIPVYLIRLIKISRHSINDSICADVPFTHSLIRIWLYYTNAYY